MKDLKPTRPPLEVLHSGNASNHGGEDEWGNEHPNQPDKAAAKRLQLHGEVGTELTGENPQDHCDQHPELQARV